MKLKLTSILLMVVLLTGCSSLQDMMPSFYDDNESKAIIDVVTKVSLLDCNATTLIEDLKELDRDTEWLILYSEAKGSRDVNKTTKLFDETLNGMVAKETVSPTYCELKKKTMLVQSKEIAKSIMRRFQWD